MILGNSSNCCVVVSLTLKRWQLNNLISFTYRPLITTFFLISAWKTKVVHKADLFSGHGNRLSGVSIFWHGIPPTQCRLACQPFKNVINGRLNKQPAGRCANLNKHCWVRTIPANSLLPVCSVRAERQTKTIHSSFAQSKKYNLHHYVGSNFLPTLHFTGGN